MEVEMNPFELTENSETIASEPAACAERAAANRLLGAGLGVGVFGAVSGALLGAVCPLCIVVAPALVGAGIYEHVGASRRAKRARRGGAGKIPGSSGSTAR
jgi:hypothetical protein